MKLELNSGLFHVTPPCCYWVFESYLDDFERQEQEYYNERREEGIDMLDAGQRWIDGLDIEKRHGDQAYRTVVRKDLPADHPEYLPEAVVELDGCKAQAFITRAWVDTLSGWIESRCYEDGVECQITATFTGTWSPKEYNWSHDQADFLLSVPEKEMRRIIAHCLDKHRKGFGKYVKTHYSSYDGFISFLPNTLDEYDGLRGRFEAGAEYDEVKHLYWAVLNYWLFGMGDNEVWDEMLWRTVADDGDKLYEALVYTPVETEEVHEAG